MYTYVVENRRDTARADTKSKKSQKSKSQKTRDTVYCIDYSQLLGQLYNTNPDPDPVTVGGKRVSTQALALWLVDALLHSLSTHSAMARARRSPRGSRVRLCQSGSESTSSLQMVRSTAASSTPSTMVCAVPERSRASVEIEYCVRL